MSKVNHAEMAEFRDQLTQCNTEKIILQEQVARHQTDALEAIASERLIR